MEPRRRWGKAGVPLSPQQAAAVDARNRRRGREHRTTVEENRRIAHRLWTEGLAVPAQITSALNLAGLSGPDVDIACGAAEPDVDLWEAGKLYPTFEQLLKLAELTGWPIRRLVEQPTALSIEETSLRFHVPDIDREPPILRYPDDVVARCPGTVLHHAARHARGAGS